MIRRSATLALAAVICSVTHASGEVRCDDIVLGTSERDGYVSYYFLDFPDLKIVPNSGCNHESECSYRVELLTQNKKSVIKDHWAIGPICASISKSTVTRSNNLYEDSSSGEISVFPLLEVTTYAISVGDEWVNAQIFRYFTDDPNMLTGLWEGSEGGGGVWIHEATFFKVFAQ